MMRAPTFLHETHFHIEQLAPPISQNSCLQNHAITITRALPTIQPAQSRSHEAADNKTAEGRDMNRRTDFQIIPNQ